MRFTLTEALSKLKLYDKKIAKKLNEIEKGSLIDVKKGTKDKLLYSGLSEEELKKEAQSKIDSLKTLIKNRAELKSKIVEANAKTEVIIANNTYTIAGAIDRKNSITNEINMINRLSMLNNSISSEVKSSNEKVESEVDYLVQSQLEGDKKNSKANEAIELRKMLLEQKEYKLIDPLNLSKLIEELNNEVEEFQTEVDVKLSIANANTFIEVDFKD